MLDLHDMYPAGAARKLYETLQEYAQTVGQDKSEVILLTPEDDADHQLFGGRFGGANWRVSWEAGPPMWATRLTGLASAEGIAVDPDDPESPKVRIYVPCDVSFGGVRGPAHWFPEHGYSFDIAFVSHDR